MMAVAVVAVAVVVVVVGQVIQAQSSKRSLVPSHSNYRKVTILLQSSGLRNSLLIDATMRSC
jgi:hypothetical protein